MARFRVISLWAVVSIRKGHERCIRTVWKRTQGYVRESQCCRHFQMAEKWWEQIPQEQNECHLQIFKYAPGQRLLCSVSSKLCKLSVQYFSTQNVAASYCFLLTFQFFCLLAALALMQHWHAVNKTLVLCWALFKKPLSTSASQYFLWDQVWQGEICSLAHMWKSERGKCSGLMFQNSIRKRCLHSF